VWWVWPRWPSPWWVKRWSAGSVPEVTGTGTVAAPLVHARQSGKGPAVLLLHGQPGSAADWHAVVPLLPDYRVIVPDRPGYGSTGGDATGFRANAEAMIALLDREGIDVAVVVGHSWAGGVAIAMAEEHASRVGSMVLVASVGPGSPTRIDDRILATPVLGELIAGATIGLTGFVLRSSQVRALSRRIFPRLSPEALQAIASLIRDRGQGRVRRSFIIEQRALLRELATLDRGLTTISAPTVILHGDADYVVPASVSLSLARSIPGATLHMLAGASHLLIFDRPQAVAAAVREAADRARSATPTTDTSRDQTAR
jgi:pimeloyl-ACP methyl ester carboxylesterase